MKRSKRLYICIGFVSFCALLIFIFKQTPRQEIEWLIDSGPNLAETRRMVVSSLKPDLKWIGELGKDAYVDTIPSQSSPNCNNSVFLIILVASSPGNFEQRNAIRSSWGKLHHSMKIQDFFRGTLGSYRPDHVLKTVFLLGRTTSKKTQALIVKEMKIYGDIVAGQFEDNYKNLVYKTRLGLTWAYSKCSSAYLLKTDDDVFINVRQLLQWIVRSMERNVYTGWCNYRSKVSRNKLSKWYVSVEDYYEDEYPPYCLGGGYLISQDILHHIIKPMYMEQAIHLEDIFIGILVNKINIQPVDNRKGFNLLFSGNYKLCDFLHVFLMHPVKPSELLNLYLQAELARTVC